MTDKQINKWLRRRFSSSGWLLTGYYMLMNFLCILAMAWEAAHQVFQNGFENLDMEALIRENREYEGNCRKEDCILLKEEYQINLEREFF